LVRDRLNAAFALALLAAVGFTLMACGRAGPLELPPGPAVAQPGPTAQAAPTAAPSSSVGGTVEQGPSAHETAMRNGFDAYGNPVAPPGQKKSFLLDPLLR
jgi:predicted small lipoprotein YifL